MIRKSRFENVLCLTCLFTSPGLAASLVVAPAGSAETTGELSGSGGVLSPSRSQHLYLASDFAGLPPEQEMINRISVRPDQRETQSHDVTWEHLRVTLSTTLADDLSTV